MCPGDPRAAPHWLLAYITGAPPKRTTNTAKKANAPAVTEPAADADLGPVANPCCCPACDAEHEPYKCRGRARPDVELSPEADERVDPALVCLECRVNFLVGADMEEEVAAARRHLNPPRCHCPMCDVGHKAV